MALPPCRRCSQFALTGITTTTLSKVFCGNPNSLFPLASLQTKTNKNNHGGSLQNNDKPPRLPAFPVLPEKKQKKSGPPRTKRKKRLRFSPRRIVFFLSPKISGRAGTRPTGSRWRAASEAPCTPGVFRLRNSSTQRGRQRENMCPVVKSTPRKEEEKNREEKN